LRKSCNEALNTSKPHIAARFGVGLARELVKIVGFGLPIYAMSVIDDENTYIVNNGLAALSVVTPILADRFMHKKDYSLAALQALAKYVATLKTEQKQQIATLFNEKYAKSLSAKILAEKDGFITEKIGGGVEIVTPSITVIVLLALCQNSENNVITMLSSILTDNTIWKSGVNTIIVSLLAVTLHGYYQVYKNITNSSNKQKAAALQAINAALK